jgi:putative PIN family toxin of toxin-antitoxin system
VTRPLVLRVVFDTNTVLSALLFSHGRLAWLREHWRQNDQAQRTLPLLSRVTAAELMQVLSYPKFRLSDNDRLELLADYLPFCETVVVGDCCPQLCRDPDDQPLLDLAHSGKADVLVSGDKDLLALAGQTAFSIETPEAFRRRVEEWEF